MVRGSFAWHLIDRLDRPWFKLPIPALNPMRTPVLVSSFLAVVLFPSFEPVFGDVVEFSGVRLDVTEHQLANGLRVLVHENHEAPTVGFATAFQVGAADESTGDTGITHILEHMLFKGTDLFGTKDWESERPLLVEIERVATEIRSLEASGDSPDQLDTLRTHWETLRDEAREFVIPNELDRIYKNEGARGVNAFTSNDLTAYILSLPSNRLELWFAMESARLERPVLREFYTEVDNVMEERRMRTDDSPDGKLMEQMLATAFIAHPYGRPVIGWPSDIRAITRTATEHYFRRHYAPNRMVLSVVGDVDADEVIRLAEIYFGHFLPQPPPDPVTVEEPQQTGTRRIEVEFDAEPKLAMAWHRSSVLDDDNATWEMLASILTEGRSSRLQRAVVQEGLASSIWLASEFPGDRYPCLAMLMATPIAPHGVDTLETVILREIERLKTDLVEPEELERAALRYETGAIRQLRSNQGLAIGLAYAETVLGGWREAIEAVGRIRDVSAKDIRDLARSALNKGNMTVATLVPERPPETYGLDPRAEAMLDAIAGAIGGEEAIARAGDWTEHRQLGFVMNEPVMELPAVTRWRNGGVEARTEIDINGMDQVTLFDGRTIWISMMGRTHKLPGTQASATAASYIAESIWTAPLREDLQAIAVEEETGNLALKLIDSVGREVTIEIDPETSLPHTATFAGSHPMTGAAMTAELTWNSWEEQGDLVLPVLWSMSLDGKPMFETRVTARTMNEEHPADLFAWPEDTQ